MFRDNVSPSFTGWGYARTLSEASVIALREAEKRSNGKPSWQQTWACNPPTAKTEPLRILKSPSNSSGTAPNEAVKPDNPTIANTPNKSETINVHGKDYTVSKDIPKEIIGTYNYEEKGEPIIQLNADGTGLLQPHGIAGFPIKIWVESDEKGEPKKITGTEGRYGYTFVIQYGESNNGNYKTGAYNLMPVAVLKDKGIAVIYGERIMKLK